MTPRAWHIRVWLLAGPVLFLLAILAVSVGLGAIGTPPEQIAGRAADYAPHMLAGVLFVLAVLVVWRLPLPALWRVPKAPVAARDAVVGAAAGAGIAVLYLSVLAPLLVTLQTNPGDYVPPGAVLTSVSGNLALFFIANVLLAPWVEETIYRGFALQALAPRVGTLAAVGISCLAFGALHWTGGLWYMVLTATVAGGAFSGLAVASGGLVAPFAAHLTLNLIEFVYAAQG